MGTINLVSPVDGTMATAAQIGNAYVILQTLLNGNLDNANISASAAIGQSKVAFDAWQTYVPVWTSSGTAPALNNGTVTGKYVQIGKTVVFNFTWAAGTTTTFGTGNYSFSLPVTAQNPGVYPIGQCLANDNSGAVYLAAPVLLNDATHVSIQYPVTWPTGAVTSVAQTIPWTWANLDYIRCSGVYEAA